jgi:hypothetical protein
MFQLIVLLFVYFVRIDQAIEKTNLLNVLRLVNNLCDLACSQNDY